MGEQRASNAWDLTGLQPPAKGISVQALDTATLAMTEPGYHPSQVDELLERAGATLRYYESEVVPALVEQLARRDEHIERLVTELSATRVTGQVLVDEQGRPIAISEAERVELEYLRQVHRSSHGGLPSDGSPAPSTVHEASLPRTPLPPRS